MRAELTAGGADVLFAYGPLGVMVVALGWIAWKLIQRETARADEAQRQVTALYETMRTDVNTALIKATEAQTTAAALLTRVAETLPDVISALRERERDRGRR